MRRALAWVLAAWVTLMGVVAQADPPHTVVHRAKMNLLSAWAATTAVGLAKDTSIFASVGVESDGFGSLKFTPTGTATAKATLASDLSPAVDISSATHVRLRYYVPQHSVNYNNLKIELVVYSNAGKTEYRTHTLHLYSVNTDYAFRPGWHTLIQPVGVYSADASFTNTNLLSYRIQQTATAASVVPIYFDELAFVTLTPLAKPKIAICVDDGRIGGGQVLAACAARGLVATAYIVPDAVGKSGYDLGSGPDNFMTLSTLLEYQARGDLIANHGYRSLKQFSDTRVGRELTPAEVRQEFDLAAEWMIANGLGRGAYYVALPGGEMDVPALDAMRGYAQIRFVSEPFCAGRSQKGSATPEDAANYPYWMDPYTPNVTANADATGLPAYAQVVASNSVGIFLAHAYGSGVNTFLDQVASDLAAGTIEVVTMDQIAPTYNGLNYSTVAADPLMRVRRLGVR